MSTMFLASAAFAIGLTATSVAMASMPAGIGQSREAVRISQSTNGVEAIHWRRHHSHNGFRLFFGQQRNCDNLRSQFDFERCVLRHRRHFHPGIFFNSDNRFDDRRSEPDFGFSIGF